MSASDDEGNYSMITYFVFPILAAVTTAATASVYCWYKHPSVVIRVFFRVSLLRYGFKIKYVQTKKYKFCYADREGDGASNLLPMVLVHGFSASKDMWLNTVAKLPKEIPVILIDLPGHGNTSMPLESDDVSVRELASNLHDFVESIGLDKRGFHLIGTSLGGAIAGIYAATYPEGVEKLTLSCPAMETPVKNEFSQEVEKGLCRLIPETEDELRTMMSSCVYSQAEMSPQVVRGILQLRLPKNDFFRRLFERIRKEQESDSWDLFEEYISKIKTPTHVVWGKEDELMHISGADLLKQHLPNMVQFDIFDNCGHSIQLECPGRFVKSLLEFRDELHLATNKKTQ